MHTTSSFPPNPPPCSEHPDLFRLPCCAPDDAFAFDLDRSPQRLACGAPAVQLVVQYSVLLPAPTPEGGPPDGSRCAGLLAQASVVAGFVSAFSGLGLVCTWQLRKAS